VDPGAQRGDVAAIRALQAIQDRLALSREQEKASELKCEFVGGQERVVWNPERSLPAKAVDVTDSDASRIRPALESWPGFGVETDRRRLGLLLNAFMRGHN
jgi:hypothetical protein